MQNRRENQWWPWFGGAVKPQGRKGDWEEELFVPHLLGGLQTIENGEDECSDIEKREGMVLE
jgi:hypothetical protein